MTGQEMVTALRESYLDDLAVPYLWTNTELIRVLNFAEVQACRRADLIIDNVTANDQGTSGTGGTAGALPLCVVPVVANQSVYRLSPKIVRVDRCQLTSMTYPLSGPLSSAELDERYSGWRGTSGTVGTAGSGGTPWAFMNEPTNTIAFILAPSTSDTARLQISRLPLVPFTLSTLPEIEEKYHEGLLDWAAHLAFMKPGEKTLNLNLSATYGSRFQAQFGPMPDANAERIRKTLCQHQRMRPRVFGS
jgi:hypothetical protein